jgi:Ala-tRNA(Pro) deacylase
MRYLGVIPGAVSPFAVINDTQKQVRVVVDLAVLRYERVNFHPLDNARTTAISGDDLMKFLRAEDHAPEVTDLGKLEHDD